LIAWHPAGRQFRLARISLFASIIPTFLIAAAQDYFDNSNTRITADQILARHGQRAVWEGLADVRQAIADGEWLEPRRLRHGIRVYDLTR